MQKASRKEKPKKKGTKRRQPTTRITTNIKQEAKTKVMKGSSIVNVRVGGMAPATPSVVRPSYIPPTTQFIPFAQPQVTNLSGLNLSDIQRELVALRAGLNKTEVPVAVTKPETAVIASARTPIAVQTDEEDMLPAMGEPIEVFGAPMMARGKREDDVFTTAFKGDPNMVDLPGPDTVQVNDFAERTTINPRPFSFTEVSSSRLNPFSNFDLIANARKSTIQSIEELADSVKAPPPPVETMEVVPEVAAMMDARTKKPLHEEIAEVRKPFVSAKEEKKEADEFDQFISKVQESKAKYIENYKPPIDDKIPIAKQPNFFTRFETSFIFNFFKDFVSKLQLKKNIPYTQIYYSSEDEGDNLFEAIVNQLNDKGPAGSGEQFVKEFEDFVYGDNGDNYERLKKIKPKAADRLISSIEVYANEYNKKPKPAPDQAAPSTEAPVTGFEPVAKKTVKIAEPAEQSKPKARKSKTSKQDELNAKAKPLASFPGLLSTSSRLGL